MPKEKMLEEKKGFEGANVMEDMARAIKDRRLQAVVTRGGLKQDEARTRLVLKGAFDMFEGPLSRTKNFDPNDSIAHQIIRKT